MPLFERLSKAELAEISAKGGRRKNPKKGFGALSPQQRSIVSKKGAKARWNKTNGAAAPNGGTHERTN